MHKNANASANASQSLRLPRTVEEAFDFLSASLAQTLATVEAQGIPRAVVHQAAFLALEDLVLPYHQHPRPAAVTCGYMAGVLAGIRHAAPSAGPEEIRPWLRTSLEAELDCDACRTAFLSRTQFRSIDHAVQGLLIMEAVRRTTA